MPAMNLVIMTSHEMHGKQHYFLGYLKFDRELKVTQPWTLRRRQSAEDAPKRCPAGIGGNWTFLPRVICVSSVVLNQIRWHVLFWAPNSSSTMCWISSFRRAISGDHSSVRTTVSFLQWLESPQFGEFCHTHLLCWCKHAQGRRKCRVEIRLIKANPSMRDLQQDQAVEKSPSHVSFVRCEPTLFRAAWPKGPPMRGVGPHCIQHLGKRRASQKELEFMWNMHKYAHHAQFALRCYKHLSDAISIYKML